MSNSAYQRWQADLLDFSVREAGQRGVLVRLCSLEEGFSNPGTGASAQGYTFVTPSYAGVGDGAFRRLVRWTKRRLNRGAPGRYHFYCLNKPHAMRDFLAAHPGIDDHAMLLWLDPDMVFNRPWEPPPAMVRRGHVAGQYWWGYDREWCRKNGGGKGAAACPEMDAAVMFPFCISAGDLRRIVHPFCRLSVEIYSRTRDWKSEMYALVMAMGAAGLTCHAIPALGTCNNWPREIADDPGAPISHYTQPMADGSGCEIWDKRKYTPCTLSAPWRRPPHHGRAAVLTDRRTLRMLHRFIDRQDEQVQPPPGKEPAGR
jgi:hypothetical protein